MIMEIPVAGKGKDDKARDDGAMDPLSGFFRFFLPAVAPRIVRHAHSTSIRLRAQTAWWPLVRGAVVRYY
ncbi:hypothetical protein [Oxalicibacterium flavum]|uniref:hypothetical protein n=1 Tax=Oxalicibacterium flavum TaxID=179467 RepID=UPI0016639205|nr:hypothetical protein [Oxalicibacterium flavum]